jgi:predicted kinase
LQNIIALLACIGIGLLISIIYMGKITTTKPVLILLYGAPMTGKTFFARQFAQLISSSHLQTDRIRSELFEEPSYDKQEDTIVSHLAEYMASEFLSCGVNIIYDSGLWRESQRQTLRVAAKQAGAEILTVWIQLDKPTTLARIQKAGKKDIDTKYSRKYTAETYKEIIEQMQPPKGEDVVVISGKHTFNSQRSAVIKKMLELGLITPPSAQPSITMPGMVNLVPNAARLAMGPRPVNIN